MTNRNWCDRCSNFCQQLKRTSRTWSTWCVSALLLQLKSSGLLEQPLKANTYMIVVAVHHETRPWNPAQGHRPLSAAIVDVTSGSNAASTSRLSTDWNASVLQQHSISQVAFRVWASLWTNLHASWFFTICSDDYLLQRSSSSFRCPSTNPTSCSTNLMSICLEAQQARRWLFSCLWINKIILS